MAFNVSALADYTEQNEALLVTSSVLGAKTASLIKSAGNVMVGVKSSETINIMDTDAIFQSGASCGFTASGSTTFTQRTVTVGKIKVTYEFAHKANGEGKFAYFFYRSFGDHPADCICQECQLTRFFSTPGFIQFLNAITGNTLNITAPFTIFTSKYSQGCFLNTHSDDMNGKLAFVYHLTKDWRPDYGGLFTAQDAQRNVLKTIVPGFNKFVCFRVGDYVTPHSVTQVSHNVQKHRMSLTGWYK